MFSLGYGRLGPTEARLGLIGVNALPALGVVPAVSVLGIGVGMLDVAGLAVAAGMLVALAVRAMGNLRALAAREPAAHAAP